MDSQIDISPRKQQLKEEYERLQKEYSDFVAKRDDLLFYEVPRLEAVYMDTIGQLQYANTATGIRHSAIENGARPNAVVCKQG